MSERSGAGAKSSDALGAIASVFRTHYEQRSFSGSGIVKRGDEVLFSGAYGYAHRGWRVPNTVSTRFDTASITKLFTAVAVLQLVERGLLSLHDGVLDILELQGTSISPRVSVYHLLTHSSGIGDDADEEAGESYEAIFWDRPNYALRETVDFLPQFVHKPANFAPGEGCRYNNCAFVLAGLVVEKLTGRKYRDYVCENVFRRAGMCSTEFVAMDAVAENAAEGYAAVTDENGKLPGWRKNIYSFPPIGSPDSGAYTTVGDLDLFMRALAANRLLSEQLTEDFFKPKVMYRQTARATYMMGYGFEFALEPSGRRVMYMQKDGENPGVDSVLRYYPDTATVVAILANQDCNVWDMADEVGQALKGLQI
ncbi:MAG: serine hydrolase domain-containing protein [Bacillota bacterium]|jgi:CubicO group peptidase (beta-lactamase class C family)